MKAQCLKWTWTSSIVLTLILIGFASSQPAIAEKNGTKSGVETTVAKPATAQFTALAAGGYHTCGLTSAGGVKCWGSNNSGQQGDGTTLQHITPVDVTGLTSGVTAIASGDSHACALTTGGGVKCWGSNWSGQLGDGTTTDQHSPVNVTGLSSGIVAIRAGRGHTCALTTGGGVKCWGYNDYGQLGDGTTTESHTPVNVAGLASGVTAITVGAFHTCAILTGGGVKCWGANWNGQLGDGTITDAHAPVDVSGLSSGVSAIAGGYEHTCAVVSGSVKCWGMNSQGQLGNSNLTDQHTPVDVTGLTSGASAIGLGSQHTCALVSGGVKCWGVNSNGELGIGTAGQGYDTPQDVSGLTSGVSAIAVGDEHNCVLLSGGGVKCWGLDENNQLGNGLLGFAILPQDVNGLASGVTAVRGGRLHTCALTSTGGVKCWGYNYGGALGDGTIIDRPSPVDVSGLTSGVTAIATGVSHSCALMAGGTVKCWGANFSGELGNGTTLGQNAPVNVIGLTNAIAIAAGNGFTCALRSGGGVKCWGYNGNGRLGDGTGTDQHTPVDVSGLTSGVSAITAGEEHACALMSGGTVKCWGGGGNGQLGNGTYADSNTPVDVSGLLGVTAFGAGSYHTCASVSNGIKCWGVNWAGQLGDGTTTKRPTPVAVTGLSTGAGAIVGGGSHTCALIGGGVKCWGRDFLGELGDGSMSNKLTPVDVSGLTSGVGAIGAGEDTTCGVTTSGALKCWGENLYAQLGIGRSGYSVTPVDLFFGFFLYLPGVSR